MYTNVKSYPAAAYSEAKNFAFSNYQAFVKKLKPSQLRKLHETQILMTQVEQLLADLARVKKNDDIVAFVGITKEGKSTLINGLMDAPLICKRDEDANKTFILKDIDYAEGPVIGGPGESETVLPAAYTCLPETNYTMWDFPGFCDNKGPHQEILNALAYKEILHTQNSIRFVLVVSFQNLADDNPLPFYEVLCELQKICPLTANNLCIVFTKSVGGNVKGLLEKKLSKDFPNVQESVGDMIRESKEIIKNVLENEAFVEFKAPYMEDGVYEASFTLPNKQQIIDCIKKLTGTKVSASVLVMSPSAINFTNEIHSCLYMILKQQICEACSSIKNSAHDSSKKIDDESTSLSIASFRREKEIFNEISNGEKDFESLLSRLEKIGRVDKQLTENVMKYRFIEDLKNSYKTKESEKSAGEVEFFKMMQLALKEGAMQYSMLIEKLEGEEEKRKEQRPSVAGQPFDALPPSRAVPVQVLCPTPLPLLVTCSRGREEQEWRQATNDHMRDLEREVEDLKQSNESAQSSVSDWLMYVLSWFLPSSEGVKKTFDSVISMFSNMFTDNNA